MYKVLNHLDRNKKKEKSLGDFPKIKETALSRAHTIGPLSDMTDENIFCASREKRRKLETSAPLS
jgi:hypothetical protein